MNYLSTILYILLFFSACELGWFENYPAIICSHITDTNLYQSSITQMQASSLLHFTPFTLAYELTLPYYAHQSELMAVAFKVTSICQT